MATSASDGSLKPLSLIASMRMALRPPFELKGSVTSRHAESKWTCLIAAARACVNSPAVCMARATPPHALELRETLSH